jgi:hypothetical protein
MNADTSGKQEPSEQNVPSIYDAADASPCDLGFWDAPWPLEPAAMTTSQRREPLRYPSRLAWVVLSLAALLIALLLAAQFAGHEKQGALVLGARSPAA